METGLPSTNFRTVSVNKSFGKQYKTLHAARARARAKAKSQSPKQVEGALRTLARANNKLRQACIERAVDCATWCYHMKGGLGSLSPLEAFWCLWIDDNDLKTEEGKRVFLDGEGDDDMYRRVPTYCHLLREYIVKDPKGKKACFSPSSTSTLDGMEKRADYINKYIAKIEHAEEEGSKNYISERGLYVNFQEHVELTSPDGPFIEELSKRVKKLGQWYSAAGSYHLIARDPMLETLLKNSDNTGLFLALAPSEEKTLFGDDVLTSLTPSNEKLRKFWAKSGTLLHFMRLMTVRKYFDEFIEDHARFQTLSSTIYDLVHDSHVATNVTEERLGAYTRVIRRMIDDHSALPILDLFVQVVVQPTELLMEHLSAATSDYKPPSLPRNLAESPVSLSKFLDKFGPGASGYAEVGDHVEFAKKVVKNRVEWTKGRIKDIAGSSGASLLLGAGLAGLIVDNLVCLVEKRYVEEWGVDAVYHVFPQVPRSESNSQLTRAVLRASEAVIVDVQEEAPCPFDPSRVRYLISQFMEGPLMARRKTASIFEKCVCEFDEDYNTYKCDCGALPIQLHWDKSTEEKERTRATATGYGGYKCGKTSRGGSERKYEVSVEDILEQVNPEENASMCVLKPEWEFDGDVSESEPEPEAESDSDDEY